MKTFATILALLFVGVASDTFADIYKCKRGEVTMHTTNPNWSEWCSPEIREEYRLKEIERAEKYAAAEKARLAKGPVKIGMTAKQVLASSWGTPTDVNRTTTAAGTREQWVYGSKTFLYFNSGILTVIQN